MIMALSHLQLNGKTDDAALITIIKYLKTTHNIPQQQMKRDYFILISKWDNSVTGPYASLSINQTKGHIVHRPDIIILKSDQSIAFIIELDGSFHHSSPGRKKTRKRNYDYDDAQIPFIALDVLALKFLDVSWFSFLDLKLPPLKKLIVAAAPHSSSIS